MALDLALVEKPAHLAFVAVEHIADGGHAARGADVFAWWAREAERRGHGFAFRSCSLRRIIPSTKWWAPSLISPRTISLRRRNGASSRMTETIGPMIDHPAQRARMRIVSSISRPCVLIS